MNDTELDQLLSARGAAFRDDHQSRPGVDWDAVTTPRRSYQPSRAWAVAGVAVVAAAVVVPLVIAAGGSSNGLTATQARAGAPDRFFSIDDGLDLGNEPVRHDGVFSDVVSGAAIGVAPDSSVAYTVRSRANCQIRLYRTHSSRGGLSSTDHVLKDFAGTVPHGGPSFVTPAMAVSPDGKQLAMAYVPQDTSTGSGTPSCTGPEAIAVINLATRRVRVTTPLARFEQLASLAWSPDGRLAYQITPDCPTGPIAQAGCTASRTLGTHIMDTTDGLISPDSAPQVLPYSISPESSTYYGPTFWRHGEFVTFDQGVLRALPATYGGEGEIVARNFPTTVYGISSDPTGDHLLLAAGKFETVAHQRDGHKQHYTVVPTVYRWDRGQLSEFPSGYNQYLQPGW